MIVRLTDKESGMRVRYNVVDSKHLARFCIKHCHAEKSLANFEETVYMHTQLTNDKPYVNNEGTWEVVNDQ